MVGVESVEGVTDVPAEESDSPSAETPGPAALGPTLIAVVGAGAVAEVAADAASAVVEAGAVPTGAGGGDGEAAGAVPVGVRIAEVAVVGAPRMVEVGDVAVMLLDGEPPVAVEPGVAAVVPM